MKTIETEITIDAAPELVWTLLTDLDNYSAWNPFVTEAAGIVAVGEQLAVTIQPTGMKPQSFSPVVTVADPNRKFEWLGHTGVKGLFDGRHQFLLDRTSDGGTRFVQREEFTGILARPITRMIGKATRQGFEAMNRALQAQAEAVARERG